MREFVDLKEELLVIANMPVWEAIKVLRALTYWTQHVEFFRKRAVVRKALTARVCAVVDPGDRRRKEKVEVYAPLSAEVSA